jgi:hypothetical protein
VLSVPDPFYETEARQWRDFADREPAWNEVEKIDLESDAEDSTSDKAEDADDSDVIIVSTGHLPATASTQTMAPMATASRTVSTQTISPLYYEAEVRSWTGVLPWNFASPGKEIKLEDVQTVWIEKSW